MLGTSPVFTITIVIFYVLGFLCASSAILRSRTPQGAAAWVVELGPGAVWGQDTPADSFVYMLAGTAETHGAALAPEGCLFASQDEGAIRLTAGPLGARVLLAQFRAHTDDD